MTPLFNLISRGKLTVLLFHKVPKHAHALDPGELNLAGFERILDAAMHFFRILPLQEAISALQTDKLPPRSACITFDDGYPEWLANVVPVLERRGVHATFFVTTGQFNGLPMWNERILYAIERAPDSLAPLLLQGSGLQPIRLDSASHRQHAIRQLDAFLKYQPPESKERMLEQLEAHVGAQRHTVPVMSADDLRAIHAKGFGIGGHSVTHPILSRCERDFAYREIAGAREDLEARIRGRVSAFAYPNGIPGKDFGPEHIAMVQRAGYAHALTTHRGVATAGTSPFQIPRFTPWGPSPTRMALQLTRNLCQRPKTLVVDEPAGRRAMMVAFHFPPQAGSSGIQRTLNFVKHLPSSGWQPTVLSAHPRAYEECSSDLLRQIPPTTRVVRAFALDAARHLSFKRKYLDVLALPDRWSSWWMGGTLAGLREIRRERPQLIWSTYPIASAHLIGATLHRLTGLPWVADFRDPMLSPGYPSGKLQRRLWEGIEAYAMQNAKFCVFTTERARQTFQLRYPDKANKCVVIENGYDEDVFTSAHPVRVGVPVNQFMLLHSGVIYPQERDPGALFEAVKLIVEQGLLPRASLKIRFRAARHESEVMALARLHGIDDIVECLPPISYADAISEMLGSDVLLVFQGRAFNPQIPAKIYEYLRTGRAILGLIDFEGDTARKLETFKCVELASIDSSEQVMHKLLKLHAEFTASGGVDISHDNIAQIKRYSRKDQARLLADVLDQVRSNVQPASQMGQDVRQP
ncbi:polysaccharide deacetylase family protein [Acidovorax sp. SRB_24]|uniref:polysaccharide deacetylase family protein n=1 Tax=Acidovorax sp. SRB_24 TaxID=1962700 RepID=UPI00145F29B0|nr:polysaccharide deacetylase family protein [Acidovorax sp. SRB_24]